MAHEVSTRKFFFRRDNNSLTANISDLGPDFAFNRNCCEVSFTLISHKTGRSARYVLTRVLRDGEGEIFGWKFTSNDPHANRVDVSIYND